MTTQDDKGREYSMSDRGVISRCSTMTRSTTRSSGSSSTPGKRLSYQTHAKRAEHWFIVERCTRRSCSTATEFEFDAGREHRHRTSVRPTAARTCGTSPWCSSKSSTVRTSVKTTSFVSRTTSDGSNSSVRIDALLAKGYDASHSSFFHRSPTRRARYSTATLKELEPLEPFFVSVTYRGGRESRQRTFDLVTQIQQGGTITAMAHLICVGHSRARSASS